MSQEEDEGVDARCLWCDGDGPCVVGCDSGIVRGCEPWEVCPACGTWLLGDGTCLRCTDPS